MTGLLKVTRNEEGSALVVALLILVFLTIIGITATKTSEVEIQIAGNERFHKVAFYNTDSGIYAVPKIISACIDNDAEADLSAVTASYVGTAGTFYREVMGFDAWDLQRDVNFPLNAFNVDVDVNRAGIEHIAGGGVEFATGAEGIGVGSAGGGVAVIFDLDSLGDGPGNSESNIVAGYRKVLGVPGGL
jgi:hypothetical protein